MEVFFCIFFNCFDTFRCLKKLNYFSLIGFEPTSNSSSWEWWQLFCREWVAKKSKDRKLGYCIAALIIWYRYYFFFWMLIKRLTSKCIQISNISKRQIFINRQALIHVYKYMSPYVYPSEYFSFQAQHE